MVSIASDKIFLISHFCWFKYLISNNLSDFNKDYKISIIDE